MQAQQSAPSSRPTYQGFEILEDYEDTASQNGKESIQLISQSSEQAGVTYDPKKDLHSTLHQVLQNQSFEANMAFIESIVIQNIDLKEQNQQIQQQNKRIQELYDQVIASQQTDQSVKILYQGIKKELEEYKKKLDDQIADNAKLKWTVRILGFGLMFSGAGHVHNAVSSLQRLRGGVELATGFCGFALSFGNRKASTPQQTSSSPA